MDARMSLVAARARSEWPFVKTVASATWFSRIDGFFSVLSSSSTCTRSESCLSSLRSFCSAYVRIESLTSTFLPFTCSRMCPLLARPPWTLTEAQRSGERDDGHGAGAAFPERGRSGGCRRAGRVDVVDEADRRRRRPRREGAANVPAAVGQRRS